MEDCERLLSRWKDVSEKAAHTELYEAFQLDNGMVDDGLNGTDIFNHPTQRILVAGYRTFPSAIRWEFSAH